MAAFGQRVKKLINGCLMTKGFLAMRMPSVIRDYLHVNEYPDTELKVITNREQALLWNKSVDGPMSFGQVHAVGQYAGIDDATRCHGEHHDIDAVGLRRKCDESVSQMSFIAVDGSLQHESQRVLS